MGKTRRGRIRNELVGGLLIVIILSCLVTYVAVLTASRKDFDALVEKNDIAIAKDFAAALAKYYEATGSWNGVERQINAIRHSPVRPVPGGDSRRVENRHSKEADIPMVLTDADGEPVFVGLNRDGERVFKQPNKLKAELGEKVVVNGKTVAYVYFKSMVFRSYNPQEEAFIASLAISIGVSVIVGLILALTLGTLMASRFAKPIAVLDGAVKTIADGDLSARVSVGRGDEIGRLAGSFNVMADKLEATETARQNLLADIAHELRTPVSIIQANLEMIIDGVYAPDQARMKSLYEETRILTGLISDLRSLSDLDIGMAHLPLEEVRLAALVEESCRKLKPLFDEKGIALELRLREEDVRVMVEEDKLRQVLRNILGNALKYGPADSVLTVSMEKTAPKAGVAYVRVTIADQGEGVPEGDTERIFERFYRVDSSRSRESGGRGLGLAICKKIVEAFNGAIGARNREPHGLSVWFELPIA